MLTVAQAVKIFGLTTGSPLALGRSVLLLGQPMVLEVGWAAVIPESPLQVSFSIACNSSWSYHLAAGSALIDGETSSVWY